jgi:hypothetical protein
MENETLLQKEIERQNFIINLLIEKNRELEQKLQSAFRQITSTDHPFLHHTQDGDEPNYVHQYVGDEQGLSNGDIYNSSSGVNGLDRLAYSNAENGETSKQPFIPISTTEIEPAKVNYHEVYSALRKQMPNAKRTAAKNAAVMMIHLCSKKNNTHHELCKVTGLTPRGMAKHIMMLKRRGYIVRTAYQQYELTERALVILRQTIH